MEKLVKEIKDSLEVMQKGVMRDVWTRDGYKRVRCRAERGKGTKAYTIRRIEILQDMLKDLKNDIRSERYRFKGE